MTRYRVVELHGLRTSSSWRRKVGVSAHVLDTLWNHRVVATYRSEDRIPGDERATNGYRIVYEIDGACEAARRRCAELNAWHERVAA